MEPIAGAERLGGVEARIDHRPVLMPAAAPLRLDFSDFYRRHRDPIARALAMTLNDADLASSATDEAMTRAVKRWSQVSEHGNPPGWVYRVGLNWARSGLRRLRRERERPQIAPAMHAAPLVDDALTRALKTLSVDHRAAIVCRYYLDYSTQQTAEALDIPIGTVKSRINRALAQLREQIPEENQ